jgi:hypothetical protein
MTVHEKYKISEIDKYWCSKNVGEGMAERGSNKNLNQKRANSINVINGEFTIF